MASVPKHLKRLFPLICTSSRLVRYATKYLAISETHGEKGSVWRCGTCMGWHASIRKENS